MLRTRPQGQTLPGYHPPAPASIPIAAVQSLIPRLATTINDIDAFKTLIASGNADGTLPNWDTLLQRYNVLLSRINALSTYMSQPPPAPPSNPQNPRPARPTYPALKTAIVHPLRELSSSSGSAAQSGGESLNPLAPQIYFQVVNTMPADPIMIPPVPIPSRKVAETDLGVSNEAESSTKPRTRALEELRKLDSRPLDIALRSLRERLARETQASRGLEQELRRLEQEGEINWGMRIEEEEAEPAEEGVKQEGDEDDLFGGDNDGEAVMVERPTSLTAPANGPRKQWSLFDYLRYMENGSVPASTQEGEAE